MKKLITTILTLSFVLSVGNHLYASVSSDYLTSIPGSATVGVTGSYEGNEPNAIYNLDITWGKMNFVYEATGEKTWDPSTHTYSIGNNDQWIAEGNTVTAINHSNTDVTVEFSFEKEENVIGTYTGEMSVISKTLSAGVENKPLEADNITSELTLNGTLGTNNTSSTKLGTITVSLNV